MLTIGVMYVESLGLGYGVDSLLKSTIVRYRPYAYSTSTTADFSDGASRRPFPPVTQRSPSAAVFTRVRIRRAESRFAPGALDLGRGSRRCDGGIGSPCRLRGSLCISDVVAGAAIGAASGFLVPFLHKRLPVVSMKAGDAVSSVALDLGGGGFGVKLSLRP